jgi:hemolysin activation/secretion protein
MLALNWMDGRHGKRSASLDAHPPILKKSIACLLTALLATPTWLYAQDFGPPTAPGGEMHPPPFLPPTEPAPLLSTPAQPPAATAPAVTAPAPALSGAIPRTFVQAIRVTGNTVFSDAELARITAPYVGRYVTDEDLATLRQALTLKYVNAGYINSGAVLPDQKVAAGVIEYRIVEGTLTKISVTGNARLNADYISDRLALGAGPPLNVVALQDQLQILLQGPFIKRINAELVPGDQPGQARLDAHVVEGPGGKLSMTVDNDLSPSLGDARVVLNGQRFSPTGRGDILSGGLEYAQGYTKLSADYGIPLNAHDTTLDVLAEWTRADVVEDPLSVLDIQSRASTLGLRLSQPVLHTTRQQLNLSLGLDLRSSQTKILGTGFAFTPGVEPDGHSQVSVLRFIQDYVDRDRSQVVAARSTLSWGLDAFGATNEGDNVPNGKFVAWLGQFQYARRLGKSDSQILFRFDGQLSSRPLLPLEQFSVGGLSSVRGYRRNQLVRDQGFDSALELRVPVLRRPDGTPLLQLAPFADMGGAWYKGRNTEAPQTIRSAGLGLHYDPDPRVHAEVYWAHAYDDKHLVNPSETLQDRGWHLLVRIDL